MTIRAFYDLLCRVSRRAKIIGDLLTLACLLRV